jgi:hypothetical protein
MTGKTPRDTQLISAKFILSVLFDTDVKNALFQMQVGSGKNFLESFIAQCIISLIPKSIVLIIHDTR